MTSDISSGPEGTVGISAMDEEGLAGFLKENGLTMKNDEARLVAKKLERDPTLTELHIFNTEWSEHASYKSSRAVLSMLPTTGPNVIMGPTQDAGIVFLANHDGEDYGLVIAHESHNHPSQVVPYEGAATGIGGIVRDVLCMGARIIATADPLRFGDPKGRNSARTKYIANAVVDGIAGYGNAIGVPNLAGDMYFNASFDDNCLVNVVSLGLVKKSDIIHSRAPSGADGYDIVIVGKATDNSGFGGAAFASVILDEKDDEQNKGAVQVPDPFLKNVLIRATEAAFKEIRRRQIPVGFKDMGAGGIMCSTSEMCSEAGFGADIDLDKVHASMDMPPYMTACSETQERFTWIVPGRFTERLLEIYNEDFELPGVAEGARASVIGKVTGEKRYVVRHGGKIVCDVPIDEITSGITYERDLKASTSARKTDRPPEPADYEGVLLRVLSHPGVASREKVYRHYDTEVQGLSVIRPGEADAGVIAPIEGSPVGVALSVDGNPAYGRIDPYWGAVNAVAEAMRNVAAVGAVPSCLTDCLCYGNPEKPEVFRQFSEGVRGVSDAARNIWMKGTTNPVPVVSGNVSFYNENAGGRSVDPSAIIACVGILQDYGRAITMKIKEVGSGLYLLGDRREEPGGSVYYDLLGLDAGEVPMPDFARERGMIHSVIDIIGERLALSCHDVSDGGLAAAVSEMVLGEGGKGNIGAEIDLELLGSNERPDTLLFSESPGFVIEIPAENAARAKEICESNGVRLVKIGETTGRTLAVKAGSKTLMNIALRDLAKAWRSGIPEALR